HGRPAGGRRHGVRRYGRGLRLRTRGQRLRPLARRPRPAHARLQPGAGRLRRDRDAGGRSRHALVVRGGRVRAPARAGSRHGSGAARLAGRPLPRRPPRARVGDSLLADGGVYVPTGSYCDMPMEGKVIRVDLATRRVSSWTSVPAALGGGGGIWGWGGVAYSARLDALFVATGNAFEGGSNSGSRFSEAAGYGEHLVELSPSLDVLAASDPGLVGFSDLDFVGSPVVADTARCGELVVAQAKNGVLFGWDAAAVAAGPVWRLKLQNADPAAPLLTQPTYSPALSAFYVVTASRLVRVSLDARCQPRLDWGLTLGKPSLYPSPPVAGGLVWVALPVEELSGVPEALLGVDARTGRVRVRRTIAGVSFAPPSALAGMLFVAGTHGLAATGFPVGRGRAASLVPGHVSRLDARHRWESREDGVYSTDDGGRHWRRISPRYADRVVRTSLSSGLIDAPYPAPA